MPGCVLESIVDSSWDVRLFRTKTRKSQAHWDGNTLTLPWFRGFIFVSVCTCTAEVMKALSSSSWPSHLLTLGHILNLYVPQC